MTVTITESVNALRCAAGDAEYGGRRAETAINAAFAIWRERLASGWEPPPGSSFPWAQVRRGVEGFCPCPVPHPRSGGGTGLCIALILAGNTPLLAWAPLVACLRVGATVFVKQSRRETLWTRLFVETLASVAPDVAARIHLDVWPGDDPRTAELLQAADAVIAFGSDAALASLRAATPQTTPFFGYGHAISVGLWRVTDDIQRSADFDDWLPLFHTQLWGFACDTLMYGQGGCLSPQSLFVQGPEHSEMVCALLAEMLPEAAVELQVPPVQDPAVARAVREARDLALFEGARVVGDPNLRWTVIGWPEERDLPPVVGHGVLSIVPLSDAALLPARLGDLRGRVSCVGVAGELPDALRTALIAEGVSRICAPGEMQTPPLGWPNGGFDLEDALCRLR